MKRSRRTTVALALALMVAAAVAVVWLLQDRERGARPSEERAAALGADAEADDDMDHGGRVAGRVVDADGRPIEKASVCVVPSKARGNYPAPVTQADGRFDVTAWGEQFFVDVEHKEYENARVDGVQPDSVVPDIVLWRKGAGGEPGGK